MNRLQAETPAELDELLLSILHKAFRGELVTQDPNCEPAEKLLEQLRQVRNEKSKPAQRV